MIKIENFRSIKQCTIDFKRINILIGENGSGKSNIMAAIKYFYDSLLNKEEEKNIFDINNKFSNHVKISITYDLTSIKKISKNHIHTKNSENIDFFTKIGDFCNKTIKTITLSKIKGKPIIWEGADFHERQLICSLFPLYTIDSRELDLTDWSNLWEYIGDLIKVKRKTNNEIKQNIKDIINDSEYKLDVLYDYVRKAFENSNIRIKHFTPKQDAASLSQIFFTGNEFELNDRNLTNNSNGVNALSYTKVLIKILSMLAEKKLKEPIILMDEPELSLHHTFIDELMDAVFDANNDLSFLISTHSPRLVKFIMKYDEDNGKYSNLFHTRRKELYTSIVKMNMFSEIESRSRARINDEYANAYFSKLILAIEGETEFELFSNYYLREIFPVLKRIDIVNKAMSDTPVKQIISPKYRNHSVPIITLIDMDKICDADLKNNKFIIKSGFKDEFFNEKYLYGKKRYNTFIQQKRILHMADKCRFHYNMPFFSSTDENYITFFSLIKEICKECMSIVADTTIEGELINKNNLDDFWEFANQKIFSDDHLEDINYWYDIFDENDKLNFARLLFNGKSDYLLSFKQLMHENILDDDLRTVIETNIQRKTDGWVSEWIEFFCLSNMDISLDSSHKTETFRRQIRSKREDIKRIFRLKFRSLYDILILMEENINS